MRRSCSVCVHPEKGQIDRALVARSPLRRVSEQFGTSVGALHRHRAAGHIAKQVAKAHEAAEASQAGDLLSQVQRLTAKALAVLAAAEGSGDLRAATGAIREARGCLELLGKVSGELVERQAHVHTIQPPQGPSPMMNRLASLSEQDRRELTRITRTLIHGREPLAFAKGLKPPEVLPRLAAPEDAIEAEIVEDAPAPREEP